MEGHPPQLPTFKVLSTHQVRYVIMDLEREQVEYRQVGFIRAAHKGRKSWNPPEAQKGLRAASLGIPADPTLGSIFLARFSTNLQRKIALNTAFETFFRADSLKPCSKIAGFLGKQGLGCLGGAHARTRPRAREAKGHKAWNLLRTLKEPLIRSSGKSLAQGQVALIDPT